MGELIHKLGIDWKLLVANAVTFFIVLWILRKFAYGPITRALDQRQATIAKGLADSKQQSQELAAFEHENNRLLAEAKQSAQALVHEAEKQSASLRQQELQKTQAEAAQLVAKTREQLERERQQMLANAKKDLAKVVVSATEKVLQETVDPDLDKKIQAQALRAIK